MEDKNLDAADLAEKLIPRQILVIYAQEKNPYAQAQSYIETHTIDYKNNKTILSAGVPLGADAINQMMEEFSTKKNKDKQKFHAFNLLDERLLWFRISENMDSLSLVWYNAPCKRKVHFSKKTYEFLVPGFVYCFRKDEFRLFTFKGANKPSEKTELFKVPFPNTYTNSTVCWGSTKLPPNRSGSTIEEMNRWENRYWNSDFDGEGHVEDQDQSSLLKLYKELHITGDAFPEKHLYPHAGLTIGKIINGKEKG